MQETATLTWMKENEENIEDAPSNNPSLRKKAKQMRSGCDNHSDGMCFAANVKQSLMEFKVFIGRL